jgi:putative oxidoreductase
MVIGALFVAHGAHKLLGRLGGGGLDATTAEFREMGLEPARRNAALAGASQVAGGAMLAAGLGHPLACAMTGATALMAVPVAAPNGLWARDGGYEYPLVLGAALLGMAADGPGAVSLDRALGVDRRGAAPALAALAAAAAATAFVRATA